jgi:hypothetical protein
MEGTLFRTVTKLLTFPLLILTTLAPSFAGEKLRYNAPKEGLLVRMEQSSEAERTMTGSGEGMFTSTSTTSKKSKISLLQ